jgi:hypothetical protein
MLKRICLIIFVVIMAQTAEAQDIMHRRLTRQLDLFSLSWNQVQSLICQGKSGQVNGQFVTMDIVTSKYGETGTGADSIPLYRVSSPVPDLIIAVTPIFDPHDGCLYGGRGVVKIRQGGQRVNRDLIRFDDLIDDLKAANGTGYHLVGQIDSVHVWDQTIMPDGRPANMHQIEIRPIATLKKKSIL